MTARARRSTDWSRVREEARVRAEYRSPVRKGSSRSTTWSPTEVFPSTVMSPIRVRGPGLASRRTSTACCAESTVLRDRTSANG